MTDPTTQIAERSGCETCVMRGLGLCEVLIGLGWEHPDPNGAAPISQTKIAAPTRRTLFRKNELMDSVPVVCEGWAVSVARLPNGRQQILSFLLPGDLLSGSLLFEPRLSWSISTVTEVCCRRFNRSELRDALIRSPQTFDRLSLAYTVEKNRIDQLAIDLGQRTAEERVARLILNLRDRLAERGWVHDQAFDFPLRQAHIADATGLTSIHVNRVIGDFRRRGLLEISDRRLKIVNPEGLQNMAEA
jgi:CRP/FNR family transcriptional regulator